MKLESKCFITFHESQQNTQWDSFTHQKRGLYHLSRTHGQKGLFWHFLHHKIQHTVCCVFVLHIALLTHECCHVKWPMWYAYTVHCTRTCLWPLWQYGLWSFQAGGTKLERFLTKNQHTQRKLLNFENWVNGEVSKVPKFDFQSQFSVSKFFVIDITF